MQRESIQAALALLLGPETEYQTRIRATRRLIKQGSAILPLILSTLSNYPEITTPAWPWWPPQYEHTSRLLFHLSQRAQLNLTELLQHPTLDNTAGPVLWTSIIEATNVFPQVNYEELLCQGLHTAWSSVRYAAAMALATRARTQTLKAVTIQTLQQHQEATETLPIRLTASYALLNSNNPLGLLILIELVQTDIPSEIRKASAFILATELPRPLEQEQQELLSRKLLNLLGDPDTDVAQHAAHALSTIALPQTLITLYALLENAETYLQITILTTLEEVARKNKELRHHMRQHSLLRRILPMLKASHPDLRRQACYTLASCGGEYIAAVMGTMIMNPAHPAQGEAIECLRFFHEAGRAPLRGRIIRWLLRVLASPQENLQVTALDSLAQLLWQARNGGHQQATQEISQEILHNEIIPRLLQADNPLLRQRTLELLAALGDNLTNAKEIQPLCHKLLLSDQDSGVRACMAYVCGQTAARWAIPALLQALRDPDMQVARTALNALSIIASTEDHIVVYAMSELLRLQEEKNEETATLAREAQTILKKWQKAKQNEVSKTLHRFL